MTDKLAGLNEAGGCAVDWTWLAHEKIASVVSGLDTITFTFESGRVFSVRSLLWQGKPFLAFEPHQAPTRPPLP